MPTEIKVPVFPESITEGTIAKWYKKPGESLTRDEHLVDIETDKVVLEVVAPENGVLESILKQEGEIVKAEEVIGTFKIGASVKKEMVPPPPKEQPKKSEQSPALSIPKEQPEKKTDFPVSPPLSPAARRIKSAETFTQSMEEPKKEDPKKETKQEAAMSFVLPRVSSGRMEKRVPMSRIRARIAERLLQAQQSAAILTTFNEINMQSVIEARQKYKEAFEKNHGVRLGFMSFFTMAVVEALKRFPVVNASIDGNDIIYHGYYDIGIAVSSPRGLVVPVIRNADTLHAAQIEKQIAEFGQKAKESKLSIEEITGGTFTISNGGVFGSLMATPILNPPQSAILGMHKIEERPIVENGEVVVRPMMYVALSYDHRIIDGAESVRFLVTIKELLEDPARFILEI